MWSRVDVAGTGSEELAELVERAARELAGRGEPAAFAQLLRLAGVMGECVGIAARATAERGSWAGVGEIAGTSRQAAWERWRGP